MTDDIKNNDVAQETSENHDDEKEEMATKIKNYTLIEILHLSFLVRDSLEYCHPQIEVSEENFERRKNMAKNMLAEGNFIANWLNNHPNEEVKKFYPQLVNYFNNTYEQENYVTFATRKVEADKVIDFVEDTIKNYQTVEEILKAFYNEYKKTPNTVDKRVEKNILASFDYYRVITNWLFFNQIITNDREYKNALKASNNKPSYEVNYNLNILKRLIGGYSFNKSRYTGDKVDIKAMLDDSMTAFKALDGTLFKEYEEANKKELTAEEKQKMAQEALDRAANECVGAIRLYEPIWRDTYKGVTEYMQENPLRRGPEANSSEADA